MTVQLFVLSCRLSPMKVTNEMDRLSIFFFLGSRLYINKLNCRLWLFDGGGVHLCAVMFIMIKYAAELAVEHDGLRDRAHSTLSLSIQKWVRPIWRLNSIQI